MPSIETRANDWRVVWREHGAKQYEVFDDLPGAEWFAGLVKAHGEHWPVGWVKGQGFIEARDDVPTFRDWAKRSIAMRSRANPRTRADYTRDIELHVNPRFGAMPLDLISREMVGNWLIDMQAAGAAAKTIKNVHNLASSIVSDAVDAGLLARNVFKGAVASLPSVKLEEMVFLTRPEFDELYSHVTERYRPLVRTLAFTGLRWSEATALQVHDVDIYECRLNVVRAWKRTPESYFEIGEPKSRRARRTLTIPASLAAVLQPFVVDRDPGEWLFLSAQGRPVRHANFRARVWVPAVDAIQGTVPKRPRIHDLRHSNASWLIAAGYNLPRVQYRLGHESITTTVDRYGHLSPEPGDDITAALDGPIGDDPLDG
jgi:integrase